MQTEEWKRQYEKYRDKLTCWTDLEAYFTNEEVGNTAVDTMDIGKHSRGHHGHRYSQFPHRADTGM